MTKLPSFRCFAKKSAMFFLKGHCRGSFAVFMSFLVENQNYFLSCDLLSAS